MNKDMKVEKQFIVCRVSRFLSTFVKATLGAKSAAFLDTHVYKQSKIF